MASAAVANLRTDATLSVLLATRAVELTRSVDGSVLPEAEDALHQAIGASRLVRSVPDVGGAVAWGSSGSFAAQGATSSTVVDVRDGETGEVERSIETGGRVTDLALSPDGSVLATAGADGWLKLWDVASSGLRASVHARGRPRGLSFSADGSRLAAAWWHEVRVIDVASGEPVARLNVTTHDTALDVDGGHVAVSAGGGAAVVDVSTGERLGTLAIPGGYSAGALAWSPDGRYVAGVSPSAVGQIWDARTGELRYSLPYYAFGTAVAWGPSSRRVVTGGSDGVAKVWWLGKGTALEVMSLSTNDVKGSIAGVAFSGDGTRLITGQEDRSVTRIWDVGPNGDAEWANLPAAPWLGDVQFLADGEHLVASSFTEGEGVTLWDLAQGRAIRELQPIPGWQWFGVSPDGTKVVVGGEPATMWDLTTGERSAVLRDAPGEVVNVDWTPDGRFVALASGADGVSIVDGSGRVRQVLREGDGGGASNARFSPNGRLLATSSEGPDGGRATIWDWEHETVVRTIETDDPGFAVAFDPSGTRLVTGGWNRGTAAIWDVATGEKLVDLGEPTASIMEVAFSPDGTRVAVAGFDHTVRIFDAATGELELTLRHPIAVSQISFSPDGTKLATQTPGADPNPGRVRVWALDIDDLLDIARREVPRSFTDAECRRYLHVERCPAMLT